MADLPVVAPSHEELRFAADPSWLGKARGLKALDYAYRAGRGALYFTTITYSWLLTGFGGPRSGGKIGPVRRQLMEWSARRRAARRAPEVLLIREASARADGEALAVAGRVRALQVLAPGRHGERTVYHHVDLMLRFMGNGVRKRDHLVYEAGCDFDLVDERGDVARVEAARAVLVATAPVKRDPTWAHLRHLDRVPGPPEAKQHIAHLSILKTRAGHVRLCDGDLVTVVGYKARMVNSSVVERLERETPMRLVIRSGAERMLMFLGTGTGG